MEEKGRGDIEVGEEIRPVDGEADDSALSDLPAPSSSSSPAAVTVTSSSSGERRWKDGRWILHYVSERTHARLCFFPAVFCE